MKDASSDRRLTIGAYAAATQLTAKVLRLYDDQGLLRPSTTDAATGYRYYRTEQVAAGRLIRALREMNLSLAQVALVLDAPLGERAVLLRSFLQEAEQRLAHERNAWFSACVDTLFDWFDRNAMPVVGYLEVVLAAEQEELGAAVRWAFHEETGG